MKQFNSGLYSWYVGKSKADKELKSVINNFAREIYFWRKKHLLGGGDDNLCHEQIVKNVVEVLNEEQLPSVQNIETMETSKI